MYGMATRQVNAEKNKWTTEKTPSHPSASDVVAQKQKIALEE